MDILKQWGKFRLSYSFLKCRWMHSTEAAISVTLWKKCQCLSTSLRIARKSEQNYFCVHTNSLHRPYKGKGEVILILCRCCFLLWVLKHLEHDLTGWVLSRSKGKTDKISAHYLHGSWNRVSRLNSSLLLKWSHIIPHLLVPVFLPTCPH